MRLDLAGRSALITGSSKGIGRAIAAALHAEGCRVAVNGRTAEDLLPAAAQLPGAVGIVGDVSKPEAATRVVNDATEALGALDILVCNVGSGRSVPPGTETPEEWQRVFALNLWSATNVIEAAKNGLIERKGAIVCISSICGLEVVPNAPVTYSAAKAALHAYVRGIARPLGRSGVRINAVAPGNILFDGSIWSQKIAEDRLSVDRMLQRDIPLASFGSPDDIAKSVVFLVSSASGFITGEVLVIDGGQTRS